MNPMHEQRLRLDPTLRRLRRETRLDASKLLWPLFISETAREAEPIAAMPGVFRHPLARAGELAREAARLGLGGVLLFGIPARKDDAGSAAWDPEGVIPVAIARMREAAPDLLVIADVCLCEYTSHGHCAPLDGHRELSRQGALESYARAAIAYARAGCQVVAPSGRFDGQVAAIRDALDGAGFPRTAILSYAVKQASVFYGPFRDAAGGAPAFGDRRSHQLDPANAEEALAVAARDAAEGADLLMVKPGLSALDLVYRAKGAFPSLPLAVYQVSGEYAMIARAADAGAFPRRGAVRESFLAFARAGADLIITYFAAEAAREGWLEGE